MGLSLPLVEFYALGLVAAWLSLAASVALVVAGAPVVELVDAVAAVVVPVWVATVSPLRQSGLGLFPMASALPQVSKVVCRLLMGLYHPVLGLAFAQERCLVLGLVPSSAAFGLDHPSVESRSVHSTQLPFCFFFPLLGLPRLGVFLGFWGLHLLCLLGFLPGWRPHGSTFSPHQVRVLGASLVVPLGLRAYLDPPAALKIRQGRLCVSG